MHCNMSLCQSTIRGLSALNANSSCGMAAAEWSVFFCFFFCGGCGEGGTEGGLIVATGKRGREKST